MQTVYDAFAAAAKAAPRQAFLCVPDVTPGGSKDTSYEDAAKRITALKDAYAKAGYGHGHRVALLLGQTPDFVCHYLALNALGCAIVPVNPDYRHDELHYLIDHSESDIAISVPDRVKDLAALEKDLKRSFPVIDVTKFDQQLPKAARKAPLSGAPTLETIHSILYTSGTTGRPKGCMLSNDATIIAGAWYRDLGGVLTIFPGKDRLYNPSPFHHVNNLTVALTCVILTQNCLILTPRFSPNRWWPEIISSQATIVHYLGVVPSMLMSMPASPDDRAHKARFGFGAGIEPQLHEPFEKRFGFPLVEIWGMTEIPRVFAANFEPRLIDTRAFGRNWGDNEARIVDDNDKEVPNGTPGEFVVRTKGGTRRGFFSGYLKNEQATNEAWKDGWFHTGDIASRDDSGMFFFVDRKKNIIRRGGENISAAEVEAHIVSHPSVAQVACIAAPCEIREEEVMACVVLKEGVARTEQTAKDIFGWVNERAAYYKTPGWMIFLDSLPLTPSQRLQRTKIFPPGVDPRKQPGVIDLRDLKKRK